MKRSVVGLILAAGLIGLGCNPAVRVVRNPGPHAGGIRYYRPKPYLFISPTAESITTTTTSADVSVTSKGASADLVTIELQYLPDFSEEYAIHVRTGFGTNTTNITLEDGWKLTQINQSLDSKFADNVGAIAELIKSVAPSGVVPPFAGVRQPGGAAKQVDKAKMYARNVPIGYYEPVIGDATHRDGKKLYGWRYVGFAPFAGCPIVPCGHESAACESGNLALYGLVMDNGVMVFKPLGAIATTDVGSVAPFPKPAPEPAKGPAPAGPLLPPPAPVPSQSK